MPNDPSKDKDFLAASPQDQHAYLMATDPDYARASPSDQIAYIGHLKQAANPHPMTMPEGTFQTHKGSPLYTPNNMPEDSDLPPANSLKGIARQLIPGLGDRDALRAGARGLEANRDALDYDRQKALAAGKPDSTGSWLKQGANEFGAAGLRTAEGMMSPTNVGIAGATAVAPELTIPALAAYGLGHGGIRTARGLYGLANEGATPENVGNTLGGAGELTGTAALTPAARELLQSRVPLAKQNASAQTALDPGWGKRGEVSPNGEPTSPGFQKDLAGARPYLGGQGISGVSDLQAKIPLAKQEIWQPAQDAFGRFGNEVVSGPTGPTTYNGLEARRLQLSAQLGRVFDRDPAAIQEIFQQGKTPESLANEKSAIEGLLDARMAREGVNYPAIRTTHGNVQGIENQVSGTNTLSEPSQPYGFGKMANSPLSINPLKGFGIPRAIASGYSDLSAGRPLWSGKPTDVNVAEGLRTGGPKPDFTLPQTPIRGLLPAPAEPMPFRAGPDPSGPIPADERMHIPTWPENAVSSPAGPTPPPVMPKFASEATGTVQPIALGPGTGGPTYQGPLRPPTPAGLPALPPPPAPVIPLSGTPTPMPQPGPLPPPTGVSASPPAPITVSTDSLGIRWARSADLPNHAGVSIPKSVPDANIEQYARPLLMQQAQGRGNLFQ